MNTKLRIGNYLAIAFMLFALFFGAGNLIFPAQLGQLSGDNITPATIGFLITGVGLPFLGIMAMGFSGKNNLQELASRVHPVYGLAFTALLYLTIGPFFAAPRTGTVAYEVGIAPYVSEGAQSTVLLIFTGAFFLIALLFSLFPSKIVDNIGKFLAPALVVLLFILLAVAFFNPMGSIQSPDETYQSSAFFLGFLEGYNTMDALAALVFGIIIINVIKGFGITDNNQILSAVTKIGLTSTALLVIIYVGISYLGATSVTELGIFENGGPVLSGAAAYYFGTLGTILLAAIIILACLTTAIGLITANAEYFHTLIPAIAYKPWVFFFSILTFVIANFGLENIISFSTPVLMFLYPLAMVLVLLTFVSPFFKHSRIVYIPTIAVTFIFSIIDGLVALFKSLDLGLPEWLTAIVKTLEGALPLYAEGLGWLLPAAVVAVIMIVIAKVKR
ncbi:branched-chain amino acid transport system II carrier protein [Oceanobacillus neutriphilus]|uniref:Branched-chain amino acid transport system carrier protein n=1 Tax=Oceanobacillus neutriphilus TaxID=531815 RepID=A0ABQ2NXH0_9BACI|nr:branched-chain amino acid transport system II carrier protein [Oceanobacillus neutriphilus]GGP13081.1 branched-chain amino acid transport system carrier protein [Oceanobacillus neutriphilus]